MMRVTRDLLSQAAATSAVKIAIMLLFALLIVPNLEQKSLEPFERRSRAVKSVR